MLTVIGAITLFFVGKFIYDTYITDNTEKNWEKFRRSNPEEAARLERNEGLNFNLKPIKNDDHKVASYIMLAQRLNCSPENVREIYTVDLRKKISSSSDVLELARHWKAKKYEESKRLNVDPDDTPASLLEKWTMSIFAELQRSEMLLNENTNKKTDEEEEYNEEGEYEIDGEYDEDDEEEYDEEMQYEDDEEVEEGKEINIFGLRDIKVQKSRWNNVIEAFGLPDEIKNHNDFSTEMIYTKQGLSFFFKNKDDNKSIIVIKINKNFKTHFPKIKETNDKNTTLNTIMNVYGRVAMNSYSTSSTKNWIGINYYPNINFEGYYYDEYDDSDSLSLRCVQIGSFNSK